MVHGQARAVHATKHAAMTLPAQQSPRANQQVASSGAVSRLCGEVVYMYAFDVAYDMIRAPVKTLLGQPVAQFMVDAGKHSPRNLPFYRPQMVHLPPVEHLGPRGQLRLERIVKLLPVGAISITVRVPFEVEKIEDLVAYHDLRFSDGSWLYDEVRALAEQIRQEMAPFYVQPLKQLGEEEAYTVFCINGPLKDAQGASMSAADWMQSNRRAIASLLAEESNPSALSDQEAFESSAKNLSYYETDIVIIDWDAAVIVDEPKYVDELLYIMELANFQLAELEAYDRILDDAVERSYRDVSDARKFIRLKTGTTQRSLRELRIDLARLSDELDNITKFFGDWHLARIYQSMADRFHLSDWRRTIDEKLKTLGELYQLLRADQINRWMIVLEMTIVGLFMLDIVILIFGR
jgi:hypothetical protein